MSEKHKIVPASYLVLFRNNKILLLRRFNTGFEDGNYSMVAGHVDPGESFSQCIIREAEEEAGISLKLQNLKTAHIMHRNTGNTNNERIDVFFHATDREGNITNKEPHKCDDISRFDMDKLPGNTIPYISEAIYNIRNGFFYSEYNW